MKYKVGDKVRIKDDIGRSPYATPGMRTWQGRIMTIDEIHYDNYYGMIEDIGDGFNRWYWSDDMIAGPAEETFENFLATRIDEAIESAKREWEEEHTEVQLVHGQHSIYGKTYTWQNPDWVPVEVGRIVKVETSKGEQPVLVMGTVKVKPKGARQYKKVLGRYGDE